MTITRERAQSKSALLKIKFYAFKMCKTFLSLSALVVHLKMKIFKQNMGILIYEYVYFFYRVI